MTKLEINNIFFNYNSKTQVFNNHNLKLEVSQNQTNKLYGIIGPSGTGKTTLLSILGGQLKPERGFITINDMDIYAINDQKRRDLICLQMQSSTSLRGSLRYNVMFGLDESENSEKQIYSDEDLTDILMKVGLWDLFKDKDGLNTLIGEGGLNLSGGQRQRLNFAGLYLRSKYYKPSLILIDEPTSSLDEMSESAITKMINELSNIAITLVVAHRLVTLSSANKILDTSLLDNDQNMNFYDLQELLTISSYYQDLKLGKVALQD